MTPTRVLIVGAGGREHALAWKLWAEPGINEIVVAPGSDGIAAERRVRCLRDVDPLDPEQVVAAARSIAAELVVIGPEAPLAAGVADALRAAGFAVFGPSRAAARIESSKAFCHDVAAAAGVRMAHARSFAVDEAGAAEAFAAELAAGGDGVVVKADGLAAGKGVTVCDDAGEAIAAIRALAVAAAADAAVADEDARRVPFVVIEERLRGPEASVIALADGRDAIALPGARDHKRLLDGDLGPNTGGMGAVSPSPELSDADGAALVASIHRPILAELARRGSPFIGALYAGLILTADGPVLLECNARFGDPETQAIMPRLAVAISPLLLAAAQGRLAAAAAKLGLGTGSGSGDGPLPVLPGAATAVVLAAAGYPEAPHRGDVIEGLAAAAATGATVFHAGTRRDPTSGEWRTNGGRVLAIVGRGPDGPSSRGAALAAADLVRFDGLQRRDDIGAPVALPEAETSAAALPAGAGAVR